MQRMKPKDRKEHILHAALTVARNRGFNRMDRAAIASQAGVTPALITKYYTTMTQMRRAVMRAAVKREIVEIIAYGIGARDKHALRASDELKQRAADWIASGGAV